MNMNHSLDQGLSLTKASMALPEEKYSTMWLCINLVFFTGTFFLFNKDVHFKN